MAAKWQLGSVPIYASEWGHNREIKRAELIKLDSVESTYQFFGASSRHYTLKGIVVGGSRYEDLETYAYLNSPQTLVTPWGNIANVKIDKSLKGTAIKYGGGMIDGVAVSVDATELIEVELELIIDA